MGLGPPVLEYARVERVGGGDRYRLWFLLAGVPGIVGLWQAVLPAALHGAIRALRYIAANGGFSPDSLVQIAMVTAFLAPLSAMVWRVLRLRGGKAGQITGIIGLTFAGIHVVGFLGLLSLLVLYFDCKTIAVAMGVALAVWGGVVWRSRTRLELSAWVLLMLVGIEMGVWAMVGLAGLGGRSINLWGLVFVATAVVRGFEGAHVLRSRHLVKQRV